jgi:hypothetical protein
LLAYSGEPTLSISEFLAGGLKPPFQLRNLSVAGGQVVGCPSKLCLKIIALLCRPALDLSLLPSEPIPLGSRTGQLGLGRGLRVSGLLQAALGLRQLVLELWQTLSLRFNTASDLIGPLRGCLHRLLRGCELGLGLLARLGDLCQLFLSAPDLCLQLTLASFEVALFCRKLIPVGRQWTDAVTKLSLLLHQALPLGLQTSKLRLRGRLRLPPLLQASFGLRQLWCPWRQLLSGSVDSLADGGRLTSSLLQLAA